MQKIAQKKRNAAYIRNITTFQYLHALNSINQGWLLIKHLQKTTSRGLKNVK